MKSLALLMGTAVIAAWGYWNFPLIIDVLQWIVGLVIGGLIVLAAVGIAAAILSSPLVLLGFLLGGLFFGDDC